MPERLDHLRRLGSGGEASGAAQATRTFLSDLGFELSDLLGGPLSIRGHSGVPIRWAAGCFFEIRDGGCGWLFGKHDTEAIDHRINLLLEILWFRFRNPVLLQIQDLVLPLEDG